jgi:hypothetical protein
MCARLERQSINEAMLELLQTVYSRYQNRYRNRVTNSTQAFSKSILK